jgi:DNA-directed RNA polymerase subunit A"
MSEESEKNYLNEVILPEKVLKEIEEISQKRRLNKDERKRLEDEVKKFYLKGMSEPGETVGIIAAQSISEPATQMTMRTYHFAGSVGVRVTYGLPRLMEIFDAKRSPETPIMTIYLKKQFNNRDMAKKIAEEIIEKNIGDVTEKVSLNIGESEIEIEPTDMKRAVTIVKVIKELIKDVAVKEKTRSVSVKAKSELNVKELNKLKEKIMKIHVSGMEGIDNAVVRREGEDWLINTIGSNLEEILKIKEVNENKSITNNIHEVSKILGIEAARNLIVSEALKTMQEQGLDVDLRHILLVGDIMTRMGAVKSIGRYGVAGAQTSILARAAFEETIKHLVRASVRNETDNFDGIFENVMVGQVIPSGTGMFELIAKFEKEEKEKK